MAQSSRPFEGLRVVEAGIALAGPFAGSLLADLGAEVVKVERPDGGDPMRLMGPQVDGVPLWWGVGARGKRCVSLDLKSPEGRERFLALVADADVLIENYRPGVMDRLGLGWRHLRSINPRLVMLSISGFGQTGPDSGRPGFGKIAEALSGIVVLTGRPGETPMHVGFSLADTSAGLMGCFAISLALYWRDQCGGRGTYIDLALFEPLLRMAECQFALRERFGAPPTRRGTNDPYGWGAPEGRGRRYVTCRTADDAWVAICIRDDQKAKLTELVGGNVGDAPDSLASAVEAWVAGRPLAAVRDDLRRHGVEAAQVHDGKTLAETPYFLERGDVVHADDPCIGRVVVPSSVPKFPGAPPLRAFRAAAVGEDNAEIFARLAGGAARPAVASGE